MKKAIIALLCVLIVAFALCGCKEKDGTLANKPVEDKSSDISEGSENGNGATDETLVPNDENLPKSDDVDLSSYKRPAEVLDLDLSKSDPSTDNVRFTFEDGKVKSYEYKLGDKEVTVTYTYSQGAAEVFAFMGDVLVADDTVELSDYNAETGFAVIDGYFFKGFTAK
ncbi:MAG: hypothetical protein IKZ59_01085 [Clostridia bacterium]|nr:hypothetical protein [Clostridia bacterium]